MKKLAAFLCSLQVIILLALVSCSSPLRNQSGSIVIDTTIPDDEVSRTYFTKDTTTNFKQFLRNPEENVRKIRAVSSENTVDASVIPEDELFAGLWESLSEEEKQMIRDNPDKAVVQCDAHLTVDNDSPVVRSVHTNNTDLLGEMTAFYGFNAKLNDLFKDKTLPVSLLPETFPDMSVEEVPAAPVFDKYVKEGNWSAVESFLAYLDYPMSLADLKREAAKLSVQLPSRNIARASGVVDHYTTALKDNLGKTLVDGAVLLESSRKKAYYIVGTYAHGGIFSKERFEDGPRTDATHCVYTAQPDEYQGFPQDMKPDRPGYACLDTIFMYTRQRRYAVVLPKGYTAARAKEAVNIAKTRFYDPKPPYSLPIAEIFKIFGDTSHDMTNRNTYCTKVVYTAWKSVGYNLDSNVFGGNIITPDDIYGSTINRYFSITISFLWWSKTYTWQTYAATGDLIEVRER